MLVLAVAVTLVLESVEEDEAVSVVDNAVSVVDDTVSAVIEDVEPLG